MRNYNMRRLILSILFLLLINVSTDALAQIMVNPTGVNVNKIGSTTVFLTFGGLNNQDVAEGVWCGEVRPAQSGMGTECVPGTIFGVLPQRFDFSSNSNFFSSGGTAFTDIMSIPASVARRAFQAARSGERSGFFYVRKFVSNSSGPDEFVSVTCRMASGGARSPLSLVNVRMVFEPEEKESFIQQDQIPSVSSFEPFGEPLPYNLESQKQGKVVLVSSDLVAYVKAGEKLPPLSAEIVYTGTGRLIGRWEVVIPGDEPPRTFDLLPESTLPAQQRGLQRRYTQLERFNIFLPPVGKFTLPGPNVNLLPTNSNGVHLVLLRIEPSDEKDSQSNLSSAGAGTGIVFAGGVAGFAIPPLRYYVIGGETGKGLISLKGKLRQIYPPENFVVSPDKSVDFAWGELENAYLYQLQIEDPQGSSILSAILKPGIGMYRAPIWMNDKAGMREVRWRILAIKLRILRSL